MHFLPHFFSYSQAVPLRSSKEHFGLLAKCAQSIAQRCAGLPRHDSICFRMRSDPAKSFAHQYLGQSWRAIKTPPKETLSKRRPRQQGSYSTRAGCRGTAAGTCLKGFLELAEEQVYVLYLPENKTAIARGPGPGLGLASSRQQRATAAAAATE